LCWACYTTPAIRKANPSVSRYSPGDHEPTQAEVDAMLAAALPAPEPVEMPDPGRTLGERLRSLVREVDDRAGGRAPDSELAVTLTRRGFPVLRADVWREVACARRQTA
jgi:hypothetical protein